MQYRLGNPRERRSPVSCSAALCQQARDTITDDPLLSGENEAKKQPLQAMLATAEIRAKLGAAKFGLHLKQKPGVCSLDSGNSERNSATVPEQAHAGQPNAADRRSGDLVRCADVNS